MINIEMVSLGALEQHHLSPSRASFSTRLTSATGLDPISGKSRCSVTWTGSISRRLYTLTRRWFFCSSAASTFCRNIDASNRSWTRTPIRLTLSE